jgi:alpha-N-acetylglucosaminidase
VRMPKMAKLPGSRIVGTAIFPEGLDTNPYAFDLYTEMAWHSEPVDLSAWTDEYATRRYGVEDAHAKRAWQIMLKTAYGYRADGNKDHGERDAAHDSLFDAQPSLTSLHAATWSPDLMRYRGEDLQPALTELLQVAPELRATATYKFDLVDLTRQVLANESRDKLPKIKAAYDAGDRVTFAKLTTQWLHRMKLMDDLLQTNEYFLLGRWLQFVPPWASSSEELTVLNYDARSILTTWGDRHASEYGLHEYANRDWAGLTGDYYLPRWKIYFDALSTSLETKSPPKPIDWYAFGDDWNRKTTSYTAVPVGDTYSAAMNIARDMNLAP